MNSTKPPRIQKTISIRKYRNIDVGDFERDIASVLKTTSELGLDGIVDMYHEGVKAMIYHRKTCTDSNQDNNNSTEYKVVFQRATYVQKREKKSGTCLEAYQLRNPSLKSTVKSVS